MNLELSEINSLPASVKTKVDAVKTALNSDWDDPVHESFYLFTDDVDKCTKNFEEICNNITTTNAIVQNVDILILKNKLECLLNSSPVKQNKR